MTITRIKGTVLLVLWILVSFSRSSSTDDKVVNKLDTFYIARGTKSVLPFSVFSFQDTLNASEHDTLLYFNGNCDVCTLHGQPAGHINYRSFSFYELKRGLVTFQHYYTAGMEKVVFNFTMNVNGSIIRSVTVYAEPYIGVITLSTETKPFVREGGIVFINHHDLNATSNFQNQTPSFTYSLLEQPQYGILEVLYEQMWVSIGNGLVNNFTQLDVNLNRIRYRQTVEVLQYSNDSCHIQVHSDQLPGPSQMLTLLIIPRSSFIKPSLTSSISYISVDEGGMVYIDKDVFSISLFPSYYEVNFETYPIGFDDIMVTVTITKPPTQGNLIFRNATLESSDVMLYKDLLTHGLMYKHDDSDSAVSDEVVISFTATSLLNLQAPIILPDSVYNVSLLINIRSHNDNIPKLVQYQALNPFEGSYIVLNTSFFDIVDADKDEFDHLIMVDTKLGHFSFQQLDTKLTSFRMSQVRRGEILFVFQLFNSTLNYNETVNISDGVYFATQELEVSVMPLSISASIRTPANSLCLFTINTMHDDHAIISKDMFTIFMDHSERLPEVIVDVVALPEFGTINAGDDVNATLFSFSDIKHNIVKYVLHNSSLQHTNDSFALQFKLGHGKSDVVHVPVCIRPLPYPYILRKENLEVSFKGTVTIKPTNLYTSETTNHQPSNIVYEIVRQPLFGMLVNSTSPYSLSSFTQNDINYHKIKYVHSTIKDLVDVDSFQFEVKNMYYRLPERFTVTIKITKPPLDATNNGFTVTEGSIHTIRANELFARAPDGYTVKIFISEQPKEGDLVLHYEPPLPILSHPTSITLDDITKGVVKYEHNTFQEASMDVAIIFFFASNGTDTLGFSDVLNITIDQVNDNVPKEDVNTGSKIFEHGITYITTDNLRFSDADYDFDSDDLKYILQINLYWGRLCLRNKSKLRDNCSGNISQLADFEWYQHDMQNKELYYIQRSPKEQSQSIDNTVSDYLIFHVTDGKHIVQLNFYEIKIEKTAGIYIGNNQLEVYENSYANITDRTLQYSLNVSYVLPTEIVYKITGFSIRGYMKNSTSGLPIYIFTQEDVNLNRIIYQQNGDNALSDSFTFEVKIRSFVSSETINITILPVDDDFPVLFNHQTLIVEQGSIVHINTSIISIKDDDTPDTNKLRYISVTCAYGKIEKRPSTTSPDYFQATSFTERDIEEENVRYSHNNLTILSDFITFYITDSTNLVAQLYNLTVVIISGQVQVTTHGLTVEEGGISTINASSIVIGHPYFAKNNGKVYITTHVKHGKLIVNGNECTSPCDFQIADIWKGHVKYMHDNSETDSDHFEFLILWPNLPRTNLTTYHIKVVPVNDQSPKIVNNSRLDMYIHQTVNLSPYYLYTTDLDTPPQNLLYIFNTTVVQKVEGYFLLDGVFTDNFTQADINDGRVFYVDRHTYDGFLVELNFSVSDGKFKVFGIFVIKPAEFTLDLITSNPIVVHVNMTQSVTIGENLLHVKDVKENYPIVYYVDPFYGQKYGQIVSLSSNTNLSSFSQSNVTAGQVLYKHISSDEWESVDYVNLTVFHPLTLRNLTLTIIINIQLPTTQNSSLAVKKEMDLKENGESCLSQQLLDGRNIRYFTWKHLNDSIDLHNLSVVYQVVEEPKHGILYNKFNGSFSLFDQSNLGEICYKNDGNGSENNHDSFLFRLMIQNFKGKVLNETSEYMMISIKLYNDEPPQLVSTLSLNATFVEGFSDCLSSLFLNTTDLDNHPEDIVYTITQFPTKGNLLIDGQDATTFTQSHINDCKVIYVPEDVGSTFFEFTISDGAFKTMPFQFNVTVLKLELNIVGDNVLTYIQSETGSIITTSTLNILTNGIRNNTRYTVVDGLTSGHLEVSGEIRNWFTQTELDHNVVMYKQTNIHRHRDRFNINASNYKTTVQSTIFIYVTLQGVTNNAQMVFENWSSQPLPSDVLDLSSIFSSQPPRISLTSSLSYGYLSYKYPNRNVGTTPITSFRYSELEKQMVYYTLYPLFDVKPGDSFQENFTGLVIVDGLAPGEFQFTLTIQPLIQSPSYVTSLITSSPTGVSTISTSESDDSSFNYTFYIPLLGLVLVIGTLLVIIIVFCCSQFKNIKHQFKTKGKIRTSKSGHKFTYSASRPQNLSPPINGNEYSDSDSSSAADIMMVQNTPNNHHPMSASHTYIPYSQEYTSSGYHSNDVHSSVGGTPFSEEPGPVQQRRYESSASIHSRSHSPNKMDQFMNRGNGPRSSSPVRRISGLQNVTRSHLSLARASGGRASPVKNYQELPLSHFSRPESCSSIGYDSSSMTQDSYRPSSNMTSMEKSSEENENTVSYRTTHPVLKGPQYWV